MDLHIRAFYNLLRLNSLEDLSLKKYDWQVEDLRKVSTFEIFQRLEKFRIYLDKDKFFAYSDKFDTPEDLWEGLAVSISEKNKDEIYLLLFELWRRLLPERQSVSIFCDELDHRIFLYDRHLLESDELIQNAITNLEEILDDSADLENDPKKVFEMLAGYCCHDIESFLYDYIFEQIDSNNHLYAIDLLDSFYPYVQNINWFNFLNIKIIAFSDIIEANQLLSQIIKSLEKEPDLDLQFEILRFLVVAGDRDFFSKLVKMCLAVLESESDFLELMDIVADFYRRLDLEEKEKAIERIINKRCDISSKSEFKHDDEDIESIKKIIT